MQEDPTDSEEPVQGRETEGEESTTDSMDMAAKMLFRLNTEEEDALTSDADLENTLIGNTGESKKGDNDLKNYPIGQFGLLPHTWLMTTRKGLHRKPWTTP